MVLPSQAPHLPINSSGGCQLPCFVFSTGKRYHSINKIVHPKNDACVHMGVEFKLGTQVFAANKDWLLISEVRQKLFFFNPFTETKIEIPTFPNSDTRSMCFTSLPTSTDWEIVDGAVTDGKVAISSIKCGDENWSSSNYAMNFDFSFCSTVIHKGLYYFLDMDANVLIYNHKRKSARVYMASKDLNLKIYPPKGQQYLVENEEKLMTVFVSNDGSWIRICQWDSHKKTWEKVSSLGNKTLFVSRPLSLCEETSIQRAQDTIHFPRFVDGHCLFYSPSTNKYYTYKSETSESETSKSETSYYESKAPLGVAAWVRP